MIITPDEILITLRRIGISNKDIYWDCNVNIQQPKLQGYIINHIVNISVVDEKQMLYLIKNKINKSEIDGNIFGINNNLVIQNIECFNILTSINLQDCYFKDVQITLYNALKNHSMAQQSIFY